MNELTDDQICDIARSTRTAEPGRDGYVLPVAFARAVIAAHRGQHDHEIEHLRADAARYQWLRKTTNFVTSKTERIDVRNQPELWDETIDAAIKNEQHHDRTYRRAD